MSLIKNCLSVALAAAALSGTALAQYKLDIDQSKKVVDEPPLVIGGPSGQELSQYFQPTQNGDMTAIALPIGCSSGTLIIEFHEPFLGFPDGLISDRTYVQAEDLPNSANDFVFIELDTPLPVGFFDDAKSLVLKNPTGACELIPASEGNQLNFEGAAFRAGPNTPWQELGAIYDFDDLAFRTYLRDTTSVFAAERCFVPGVDNVRSAPYAGTCRCFADIGQGKMRCNGAHPHFSIVREIPWPLVPGEPYREVWKFTRYRKLDGTVRMRLEGAGFDTPVTRTFGNRARPGMIEAVAYDKIAPSVVGETPGIARFHYDMQETDSDSFEFFGFDTTITEENFNIPQ